MKGRTFWTVLIIIVGVFFILDLTLWPKSNPPAVMQQPTPAQTGANDMNPAQYPQPTVTPSSGPVGTVVTVHGGGFTATGNTVAFFNMSAPTLKNLSSPDGNTLTFTIPAQMTMYCQAGIACPQFAISVIAGPPYQVKIISGTGFTQYAEFTVTDNSGATVSATVTSTPKSAPKMAH